MPKLFNGYVTHPGLARENNEDYFGYYPTANGTLAIVADGMGGMGNGSIASRLAVETMRDYYVSNPTLPPASILHNSATVANKAIENKIASQPSLEGMGTTAVTVLIQENMAFVSHIGDSRVYLITSRGIQRITRDHTSVQKMVEEGLVSPENAAAHPMAHVVQRALGHKKSSEVEVAQQPVELHTGDALLLCSDGLTDLVNDEEIRSIVSNYNPQNACNLLLELVLKRGANDNTTIQVIRYGVETLSERVRRTSNISPIPKELEKDLSKLTDRDSPKIVLSLSWSKIPLLWKIRLIVLLFIFIFLCGYLAVYYLTSSEVVSFNSLKESFSIQILNFAKNIGVSDEMSILPS